MHARRRSSGRKNGNVAETPRHTLRSDDSCAMRMGTKAAALRTGRMVQQVPIILPTKKVSARQTGVRIEAWTLGGNATLGIKETRSSENGIGGLGSDGSD